MMRNIKSLPIIQLLALSCLLIATGNDGKVVVGTTRNDETNGTVSIVDIQDHNKTQYYNSNFEEGNYNYGYDIRPSGPNGQFHHENKASDGVVYGCYGYLDPNNMAQITFYISDAWGYRPVRQEQPVEVFFPAQNPEGTTDMKGETIQWTELVFPEKCTYFAQQVAVAASSNVGQTLLGTPFAISPATQQTVPFTIANRRPTAPIVNQLTTPIVVTPLGGTGNSRPAIELLKNPNPSIRTPSTAIRTPSPTIQTPFAPIRNPTPLFIPFTAATSGDSTTGSGTRIQANINQGFGQNGKGGNQGGHGGIGNNGNTGFGSNGNGGFGNNGNGGFGNNGNGGFGNNGNGGFGNNGNGGFGNNENGGLGFSASPSPPSGFGSVGTPGFIENSSPVPNSVVIRRPGDASKSPGTSTSTFGNGNGGSPKVIEVGGRITSPNPGEGLGNGNTATSAFGSGTGKTNSITGSANPLTRKPNYSSSIATTDRSKIGNEFGSSRIPSTSGPITQIGGNRNTGFSSNPSQSTNSRRPTENPSGGVTNNDLPSSFYTEGSSSSIYPDGNVLSTGGPGSQPSSSNNIGETLEQEVEGSSSAIFPGKNQPSTTGNKSGALKTLPNGSSGSFNNPTGSQRPLISQTPTYQANTATTRPAENPTQGSQPIRNGNIRDEHKRPNGAFGNGGTSNNPASFTNQPSRHVSNEQPGSGRTPNLTTIPSPSPSSSEEFGEIFQTNSPLDSSASCPQICNSCSGNRQANREEIDYSQIPGAVISNVPVIFYPDCSTNAFSRPAVVPFCPSKQQASCSNQPLTMKFPHVSSYNGNSNGPAARNAFASSVPSRTSRRVIRKTRPTQTEEN